MQSDGNPVTPEILQQNPLLGVYIMFVFAVVLMGATGFFASWGLVFYRRNHGQPILPMTLPWEPRRWSFVEVFFIVIGWITLNMIMANVAAAALGIQPGSGATLELAGAASIGSIVTVILGTLWICVRYKTTVEHVGFGPLRGKTIAAGVIGGLATIPLMYVLMAVVSSASQTKYEHPLIDSAVESATLVKYLLAVFSAAIVAPIVEEFLFRVILQGWLQSIPFRSLAETIVGGQTFDDRTVGGQAVRDQFGNLSSATSATPPAIALTSSGQPNYSSPVGVGAVTLRTETTSPGSTTGSISGIYAPSGTRYTQDPVGASPALANAIRPPFWPSIVAGLLFGLMHYGYGLSFIPLSFLGIFLGWIYRQTHSIWPCILIHMMLNSFSMMMLGLVILMKQAGIELQQ